MSNESSIVSKVWSFANILRDDGVGYGDYLEQLIYLLFLKMVDEFAKPPYNRKLIGNRPRFFRAFPSTNLMATNCRSDLI